MLEEPRTLCRRTIGRLNPNDILTQPQLKQALEAPSVDPALSVLCKTLYIAAGRRGELLGYSRERTERTSMGRDGRVHTTVYEAFDWPGVKAEQFRWDVEDGGELWMEIRGWPVEKKVQVTFRTISERMTHPFIPTIQEYVLEDPEPKKPLFRQRCISDWQLLMRQQLPAFWFHYFRSARWTNCMRRNEAGERMSAEEVSRLFDVDIKTIMHYWKALDTDVRKALPRSA